MPEKKTMYLIEQGHYSIDWAGGFSGWNPVAVAHTRADAEKAIKKAGYKWKDEAWRKRDYYDYKRRIRQIPVI